MNRRMEDFPELRLFKRREAAQMMSISIKRLNDLIHSGKIEFIQLGKSIYIPYVAIKKFIEENLQTYQAVQEEQQYDNIIFVNHSATKEDSSFDSAKYVEQLLEEYIG